MKIKTYSISAILFFLIFISCGKKVTPTVVPPIQGSVLHFRGYVTNAKDELASEIYFFNRYYSHEDTLNGIPVHVCYSNHDKIFYYTDKKGTVRQYRIVDLGEKILPYKYFPQKQTRISYWETLLKRDHGEGTEWQVKIDTTFNAVDEKGKQVKIRYYYLAKAKYNGWNKAFIPETQEWEKVLDTYWYKIEHFIVNQTSGDTLFIKRGNAHHYFSPEKGLIKYITDYKKKEKDQDYIFRKGTWELIKSNLPGVTKR